MSKKIKLSQGKYAIIDDCDYDQISQNKWSYNCGYAVRAVKDGKKRTLMRMHVQIAKPLENERVYHINGDNLDNRRENLRLVSKAKNTSENAESQVLRLSKNTMTAAAKIRIVMGDKYADELAIELTKTNTK